MSRVIYKYVIPDLRPTTYQIPVGAQFLKVAIQDGQPCVWALIETNNPMQSCTFEVYGTGHDIPINTDIFIDTFFQPPFVWHAFVKIQETP